MIILRVGGKYGSPVQTATARKLIAKALLDNPAVEIEVFNLVASVELTPTRDDRAKAAYRKKAAEDKWLAQKAQIERDAALRRLAQVEAEASALRQQLGGGS